MQKIIKKTIYSVLVLLFLAGLAVFLLLAKDQILKKMYPLEYKELVYTYSTKHEIDPFLTFAVIKAESGFNCNAVSNKNAIGLMQLTESTASWGAVFLKIKGFKTSDLYQPETNIRLGTWYLARLIRDFDSDIDMAVAAYNAGGTNVLKWLSDPAFKESDSASRIEKIPFAETREFVKRVKKYRAMYESLYGQNNSSNNK